MTLEEIKAAAMLGATFTGHGTISPHVLREGIEYSFHQRFGTKGRFDPVGQPQHGFDTSRVNLDHVRIWEAPHDP